MAKDRVLNSVNNEHADRCVDFFVRPDGTHGFKEYRRDAEDPRGWYLIAFDPGGIDASHDEAVCAARARVVWLANSLQRSPPFVP